MSGGVNLLKAKTSHSSTTGSPNICLPIVTKIAIPNMLNHENCQRIKRP